MRITSLVENISNTDLKAKHELSLYIEIKTADDLAGWGLCDWWWTAEVSEYRVLYLSLYRKESISLFIREDEKSALYFLWREDCRINRIIWFEGQRWLWILKKDYDDF